MDLASFVQEVNESLPGAEGCETAHLTLIKQLNDSNVEASRPKDPDPESYEVEGFFTDDDNDDK